MIGPPPQSGQIFVLPNPKNQVPDKNLGQVLAGLGKPKHYFWSRLSPPPGGLSLLSPRAPAQHPTSQLSLSSIHPISLPCLTRSVVRDSAPTQFCSSLRGSRPLHPHFRCAHSFGPPPSTSMREIGPSPPCVTRGSHLHDAALSAFFSFSSESTPSRLRSLWLPFPTSFSLAIVVSGAPPRQTSNWGETLANFFLRIHIVPLACFRTGAGTGTWILRGPRLQLHP